MIRILQALGFSALMSQQTVATSATGNSSALDTLGKGDTLFLFNPTAIAGAASEVKIQESSDNSTWTDISGATLATPPTASDDGNYFGIIVTRDKTGHKRYLRASWTQGGSGNAVIDCMAISESQAEFPINASDAGFTDLTLS